MELKGFEHHNPPARVVFGAGSVTRLPALMADVGSERAVVVCGRTVSSGPQLACVRKSLDNRLVFVFDGVRPHGGIANLQEGADIAKGHGADVLVSVGGGSTIDSAKCIALLLAREAPLDDYLVEKAAKGAQVARALPSTTMAHIAIPTTAGSSSEVMPWAGIRDEATRRKLLFRDPQLIPDVAVLDPEIVVPTGARLTASSGVTAVARAVEALYSRDRQPITDALAVHCLRLMRWALPRAVAEGSDLEARGATQIAALISGIAADNAMASLVHAVGHIVGGQYALQHGIAHRILLPRVARLALPAIGSGQFSVAEALGVDVRGLGEDEAGVGAVEALEGLLDVLPLPQRLREVGVERDDLDDLAEATMADPMFTYCPRPFDRLEVRTLIEDAW